MSTRIDPPESRDLIIKILRLKSGRFNMLSNTLSLSRVLLTNVIFALGIALTSAYAAPAEPTNTPLPKTGTLSSSQTGGYSGATADGLWGNSDPWNKDAAPISGSVSRGANDSWIARLFNNSTDPYSVSVALRQINNQRTTIKTDSFSVTLKGGEKAERTVSGAAGTSDATLDLVRWKNLKKLSKKTEEGSASNTSTDKAVTANRTASSTARGADGLPLPTSD